MGVRLFEHCSNTPRPDGVLVVFAPRGGRHTRTPGPNTVRPSVMQATPRIHKRRHSIWR
jgi:hypothetical protein